MRIAITGAAGFVGSHLIRHLARDGHSILAIGRRGQAPAGLEEFAEYYPWDISTVAPTSPKIDVIIHAAAMVEFSGNAHDMYRVNIEGTRQVLAFGAKANHCIFVSSSSVYPTTTDNQTKHEQLAGSRAPGTLYGQTKLAGEKMAREWSAGRKVTILRPHAIYGPGDRHLLPGLLARIRQGSITMIGSGQNLFSVTHIGNFCLAVSAALHSQKQNLGIYNIADETSLPLETIISRIFQSLQYPLHFRHLPISLVMLLGHFTELGARMNLWTKESSLSRDLIVRLSHSWVVSLDAAIRDLEYQPLLSLSSGCQDIASWVESIGGPQALTLEKIKDSWQGKIFTY